MKIAVYNSISNELACIFDVDCEDLVTYGSFRIKQYGDNFEPICETNLKTDESFLIHNTSMYIPDSLYEIEEEEDDDK